MHSHLRAEAVKCPFDSCNEKARRHDNLMRHIRKSHLKAHGAEDPDRAQELDDNCSKAVKAKFRRNVKSQGAAFELIESILRWDNAAAALILAADRGLIDCPTIDFCSWCSLSKMSLLFCFVHENQVNRVEQLIGLGANINVTHPRSRKTPLHMSSERGFEEITEVLLKHGANIDPKSDDGTTPLYAAIACGHISTVRLLIARGASVECLQGHFPLHKAVKPGIESYVSCTRSGSPSDYKHIIEVLLRQGFPVDDRLDGGETALQKALLAGRVDIMKLLIDHGADPDASNIPGRTALHTASKYGELEMAELLINSGAKANASDCTGRTALHTASKYGELEMAELLINSGAKADASDCMDRTALHEASEYDKLEMVELLINSRAKIDASDSTGQTALHKALWCDKLEIAELLINSGAKVDAPDHNGWTPFAVAILMGRRDIVRHLLGDASRRGKLMEDRNPQGRSALLAPSASGQSSIVQLLLELGAEISIRDEHSWTLLEAAAAKGQEGVVQILLDHHLKLGIGIGRAYQRAVRYGHDGVASLLLAFQAEPSHGPNDGVYQALEVGTMP